MTTNAAVLNATVHPIDDERDLNVALWMAQVMLAVVFAVAGTLHLIKPMAELAQTMGWTASVPEALVRFLGVIELAGAVGLVLPSLTRIVPALTGAAAAGLAYVMSVASLVHLARGEWLSIPLTLLIGGWAVFVAWGRLDKAPITPRA